MVAMQERGLSRATGRWSEGGKQVVSSHTSYLKGLSTGRPLLRTDAEQQFRLEQLRKDPHNRVYSPGMFSETVFFSDDNSARYIRVEFPKGNDGCCITARIAGDDGDVVIVASVGEETVVRPVVNEHPTVPSVPNHGQPSRRRLKQLPDLVIDDV